MSKSPHSTAPEESRERVVFVDILEKQMLDLEALRDEVAKAELMTSKQRATRRVGSARARRWRRRAIPSRSASCVIIEK